MYVPTSSGTVQTSMYTFQTSCTGGDIFLMKGIKKSYIIHIQHIYMYIVRKKYNLFVRAPETGRKVSDIGELYSMTM
jgi:hypothetical protein